MEGSFKANPNLLEVFLLRGKTEVICIDETAVLWGSGRLLDYMLKRKGASILPCGRPFFWVFHLLPWSFSWTWKHLLITLQRSSSPPMPSSLCTIMWCWMVSWAKVRSMKAPPIIRFFSNPSYICSVRLSMSSTGVARV